MAEVLLFHHVQGLTPGVHALAEPLRAAGHVVHVPDLFEGRTFATIDEGMAHVRGLGVETVFARGVAEAEQLPAALVYAGISMGGGVAQQLAQTRPGARGAVLLETCFPVSEFGGWPDGVPVEVHGMDADPFFAEEDGDLGAARELVATVPGAALHLYPGDRHLFTDSSLPAFDPQATALVLERVLALLARV